MGTHPYMHKLSLKELAKEMDELLTDEDRLRIKELIKKQKRSFHKCTTTRGLEAS